MNFIEVCAGCGGLSQGFIEAGWKPLLLNDINKDCCETLHLNHPNVQVVCGKMNELQIHEFVGKIDLLMGGVPCQSFSQVGKRKGLDDERGQLIFHFIDMIKKLQPKMFLIENVKGLTTHNKGETLSTILSLLEKIGCYNIYHKVLNAFDYNVPQKRERLFIIGISFSIKQLFEFPIQVKDKILLKDVLVNVPKSPCAKYSNKKKELFKSIKQGGCWVDLPINIQKQYLGKSYESGGGKRGILRRLSMDEPSLTLLCTPTQKQTERCHPLEERPLSIREYARIQTFDDSYQFSGTVSSQYRQIGNAVPVKLANHIARQLLLLLLS